MKLTRVNNSTKSERLTITLAEGQRKRIKSIAEARRVSEATVIRWALDEYIVASDKVESRKRRPKSR